MVDFIKISVKTSKGIVIDIYSRKYFDKSFVGYEIFNGGVDDPKEIKFINDDSIVNEAMAYLAKSLYTYYNGMDNINMETLKDYGEDDVCRMLKTIIERFSFLESSQITRIEFGFELENLSNRKHIEAITKYIFKTSSSNLSTTHPENTTGKILPHHGCTRFSIKIKLPPEFLLQLVN
jgi:hypothetical protein